MKNYNIEYFKVGFGEAQLELMVKLGLLGLGVDGLKFGIMLIAMEIRYETPV